MHVLLKGFGFGDYKHKDAAYFDRFCYLYTVSGIETSLEDFKCVLMLCDW